MAINNIPPPPASAPYDDFRSPQWQAWFRKVGQTVSYMVINNVDSSLENVIFGKREQVQRLDLNSVDHESILSGQIFGS